MNADCISTSLICQIQSSSPCYTRRNPPSLASAFYSPLVCLYVCPPVLYVCVPVCVSVYLYLCEFVYTCFSIWPVICPFPLVSVFLKLASDTSSILLPVHLYIYIYIY